MTHAWADRLTHPLRHLRLRSKVVFVALFVTLASSLSLAAINYIDNRNHDRNVIRNELQRAAEYSVDRMIGALDLVEADSFRLSLAPEVAALTAGAGPAGLAPARAAELKGALEHRFASLLAVRRAYSQVRLIGRADAWRELVRINRRIEGFEPVRGPALQSKGNEPYLAGIDRVRPGESYYSEVSFNREWGVLQGRPMLRLIRPVFDDAGQPVAAIVINADFERLLQWTLPLAQQKTRVVVVNSKADFMVFERNRQEADLQFHETSGWQPPADMRYFTPDGSVAEVGPYALLDSDAAIQHVPLGARRTAASPAPWYTPADLGAGAVADTVPRAALPFRISLFTEYPQHLVFAASRAALSRGIITAAVLALMTMLLTLTLSTRILAPLTRLTRQVHKRADRTLPLEIPELGADEVGELARELTTMSNALIRETRRLDNILMSAADAIVTIDGAGLIIEANTATERIFGYRLQELTGQPLGKLMFAEDAAEHQLHVDNAVDFAGPHSMAADRTLCGRRKDGTPVPIEISVSCTTFNGQRQITGVIRDVTERRRAQERQEELLRELERSNAELDQFAYIASHDLKAPLRVIDNASRWLEEDLAESLSDDTRESMELMRSRVARMERLLEDLLQHSRIGRIAQPSTLMACDKLIEEVRALAAAPDTFTLEMAPDLSEFQVLRMPLLTVLLNLVSNAVKHHDGPHATVRIGVEDAGDMHIFSVADDGPGIPPAYHAKVFELFQTLQPRDRVDSSGMGLAVVRKHVEVAGGRIELISDGGRGATFRVHWPKPQAPQNEAAA